MLSMPKTAFEAQFAMAKIVISIYPNSHPIPMRQTNPTRENFEKNIFGGEPALCVTGFSDGISVWQSRIAYEEKRNFNRVVYDEKTNRYLPTFGAIEITYAPDESENAEDMPQEVYLKRMEELYWPQTFYKGERVRLRGEAYHFGEKIEGKDNFFHRNNHVLFIDTERRPVDFIMDKMDADSLKTLLGYPAECVSLDNGDGVVLATIKYAKQVFEFNRRIFVDDAQDVFYPIYGPCFLAYSEKKTNIGLGDLKGLSPELIKKYSKVFEFPERCLSEDKYESFEENEIEERRI